jgi:hypothetical protein
MGGLGIQDKHTASKCLKKDGNKSSESSSASVCIGITQQKSTDSNNMDSAWRQRSWSIVQILAVPVLALGLIAVY